MKSPKLEPYQIRILHSVRDNERTVVSACHDVGKTFTSAEAVLWFLYNFPGAKVITTAPTFRQVELLLWKELHGKIKRAGGTSVIGGNLTKTRLEIAPDWFAVGFKPDDGAATSGEGQDQSNFQGIHAKYVFIVFDEATGIRKSIWDQAEGMMTSGFVRFLAIGNPTSRECEFFKCFSDPLYHKIKLSCFDSPNLQANGIYNYADLEREYLYLKSLQPTEQAERLASYKIVNQHLLALRWVMGRALKWGMNHPLFVSKVLGEFPKEGSNVLIPMRYVEAAMYRQYDPKPHDRKTIGVDVARFGTDDSVLTAMHGAKVVKRKPFSQFDTSAVTGEVIAMYKDLGANVIVVDGTGIGAGVVDQLNQAKIDNVIAHDVEIREVHFGAGVTGTGENDLEYNKEHFFNLKALMFNLLSDDLKKDIQLPEDEEVYLEELPTIVYKFGPKGHLMIESKDEYKKRTGRQSPDSADSLILANYGRYMEMEAGTMPDQGSNDSRPNAPSLDSKETW